MITLAEDSTCKLFLFTCLWLFIFNEHDRTMNKCFYAAIIQCFEYSCWKNVGLFPFFSNRMATKQINFPTFAT